MSEKMQPDEAEQNAARLKSRNRVLGLALGGLVLFLFIVSYYKIEKAEPAGDARVPVPAAAEEASG